MDNRCRWEADREGQDQCVLIRDHAGPHQYGPVVFVDSPTPVLNGRAAKILSARDLRLKKLAQALNRPELNVKVNDDGTCSSAEREATDKLRGALREHYAWKHFPEDGHLECICGVTICTKFRLSLSETVDAWLDHVVAAIDGAWQVGEQADGQ